MSSPGVKLRAFLCLLLLAVLAAVYPVLAQDSGGDDGGEDESEEGQEEGGDGSDSGEGGAQPGGDTGGNAGGTPGGAAQGQKPFTIPRLTEQTGIQKDTWVYQNKEEPYFQFDVPKTKKNNPRDKFVFIDLEARVQAEVDLIQPLLDAERGKEPQEEEKVKQLSRALDDARARYYKVKCLLETKAPTKEDFNKETPWIKLLVDTESKEKKATQASLRDEWKQRGIQFETLIADKDITSKQEQSKNRFTYHFEAIVVDKGKKFWVRNFTYLVYNKKSTTRFKVQFIHVAPFEIYNADPKAFLEEANLLMGSFRLL